MRVDDLQAWGLTPALAIALVVMNVQFFTEVLIGRKVLTGHLALPVTISYLRPAKKLALSEKKMLGSWVVCG